jgi:hypothetical protein
MKKHFPTDFVADAAYYRMTAITYWECAKLLEKGFADQGQKVSGNRLAVPFYLLVSHCIELLLKCALMKRGLAPSKLKGFELRHDFCELLSELLKFGVPISEPTQQLVTVMSDQHKRHAFRYSVFFEGSEAVYVPEPKQIYQALEELLMVGRINTHGV